MIRTRRTMASLAMLLLAVVPVGCSQISSEERFVACQAGGACPKCHGQGNYRCEACFGRGNAPCPYCNGRGSSGMGTKSSACFACSGKGMTQCTACDGRGMVPCGTTLSSFRCRACGAQYDYRPTRCPKCGAE